MVVQLLDGFLLDGVQLLLLSQVRIDVFSSFGLSHLFGEADIQGGAVVLVVRNCDVSFHSF